MSGSAPAGVTATDPTPSSLTLTVAAGSDDVVVNLDVSPAIRSLVWRFEGLDLTKVHPGVSPNAVGVSPYVVTAGG